MSVRVSDIMTADVITVGPEAFVHKAARLMSDHGVSGLPIVDADGRVIGIVPKAISSSGRLLHPEALAREAVGVHA
jgi:CBS domain-containing protein